LAGEHLAFSRIVRASPMLRAMMSASSTAAPTECDGLDLLDQRDDLVPSSGAISERARNTTIEIGRERVRNAWIKII
jgi:hypothetical protein